MQKALKALKHGGKLPRKQVGNSALHFTCKALNNGCGPTRKTGILFYVIEFVLFTNFYNAEFFGFCDAVLNHFIIF